ncbi:hypothetical protein LFML04_1091 [Leptospirillum ferriphilum ML-04]|uniref:Uncharacterized protein n=1 Tax=Leptospirillum ferriphilum (strain ML-04) TaxID=1048260 RepID=J9ZB34_LEPFM|nr:hypothetical protein LFML04_1091 [Leptospirillum ferriphilum ML-04]
MKFPRFLHSPRKENKGEQKRDSLQLFSANSSCIPGLKDSSGNRKDSEGPQVQQWGYGALIFIFKLIE